MAFVEQAHVNDIGTIFRVTVYDTTSAGGTTVADISSATTKKFTFKDPMARLLKKPLFLPQTVQTEIFNTFQLTAI